MPVKDCGRAVCCAQLTRQWYVHAAMRAVVQELPKITSLDISFGDKSTHVYFLYSTEQLPACADDRFEQL